MSKVRPIKIEPITYISLRAIVAIFLAVFGAGWLMIEPLSTFGLLPKMSVLSGWIGYLALVAVSLVVTILLVPMYRQRPSATTKYLIFTVASASDGAEHAVKSPAAMLVGDFVQQFAVYLSKGAGGEAVKSLLRTHDPILQIVHHGNASDLSNSVSLAFAGIVDGTHCQISARPKEDQILFSRRLD